MKFRRGRFSSPLRKPAPGRSAAMSGTFVEVTKAEFDAFLLPSQGWVCMAAPIISGSGRILSNEVRYKKRLANGLVFCIYTTIICDNLVSRACGQDAIRIAVYNTGTGKGVCGGIRVLRTKGWQDRVQAKVWALWDVYVIEPASSDVGYRYPKVVV